MDTLSALLQGMLLFAICVGIYELRERRLGRRTGKIVTAPIQLADVEGNVTMDCRGCTAKNRIPYDQLLKRPICGRCKQRLLPGTQITFETARRASEKLRDVWGNYDRLWPRIHNGLFFAMSTTAPGEHGGDDKGATPNVPASDMPSVHN